MNNIIGYKRPYSSKVGVYRIRNVINNKVYIGSTSTAFSSRKQAHFNTLRKNKHHSEHLQKSYNKYGENNFIFEILEICNKNKVIKLEQKWLDKIKSYLPQNGYNLLRIAGSCKGRVLTQEHKDKISKSEKGKHVSKETKLKLSIANKGKGLGETRPLRSEETKRKIGNANRGRRMTEATKKKISKALKGRKYNKRK